MLMSPSNQVFLLSAGLLVALFGVFLAIGIHIAINKAFSLLDGHLERFQGKLDVLVAAQAEYNVKLDAILRKLF
jgi:hypothetical protein